jgi:hypothetical protein
MTAGAHAMPSSIRGNGPASGRRTPRASSGRHIAAVRPFGPSGPLRTDAQRTADLMVALERAVLNERARRRR